MVIIFFMKNVRAHLCGGGAGQLSMLLMSESGLGLTYLLRYMQLMRRRNLV